jgi:hypothetical protein
VYAVWRIATGAVCMNPAHTHTTLHSDLRLRLENTTQPALVQDDFEDGDDLGWLVASSTWRAVLARG